MLRGTLEKHPAGLIPPLLLVFRLSALSVHGVYSPRYLTRLFCFNASANSHFIDIPASPMAVWAGCVRLVYPLLALPEAFDSCSVCSHDVFMMRSAEIKYLSTDSETSFSGSSYVWVIPCSLDLEWWGQVGRSLPVLWAIVVIQTTRDSGNK